ncbi:hypothetical protein FACS1894156_1840 [Bacteroidia bacterium]|nr:hypothetical protein FACS1894156_1840 [Bacteroidia bacterium]
MSKVIEPDVAPVGINRICDGTEIEGTITTNNDIRIDGVLNGNITSRNKLVVGETGKVKGDNIIAKNADILGSVTGKISISDFLSLKSTARVTGDIKVNRLMIEVGATFSGTCDMSNATLPKNEKG